MGVLTEVEIFDCLSDNFRKAASLCEDLAKAPRKGPNYKALRECLKLLEGACRQAAHWRTDARWLDLAWYMDQAHKRAGDWLRGIKQPGGGYRAIPEGQKHPLFMKLAENLRAGHAKAEQLRTKKTSRVGAILPVAQPAPHRDTRPVGYRKTASGLYLPTAA